jgi:hypothetical protein
MNVVIYMFNPVSCDAAGDRDVFSKTDGDETCGTVCVRIRILSGILIFMNSFLVYFTSNDCVICIKK